MYSAVGKKFLCTHDVLGIKKDEIVECFNISDFKANQPYYVFRIQRVFGNVVGQMDIIEFEHLVKVGILVLIGSIKKKVDLRKKGGFKGFVKKEKEILRILEKNKRR